MTNEDNQQKKEEEIIFNIPPTTSDYYKQILRVKYIDGYKLELIFLKDNEIRIVDLEYEFMNSNDKSLLKYRNIELFKQVKTRGYLTWNDELIMKGEYLYKISTPI